MKKNIITTVSIAALGLLFFCFSSQAQIIDDNIITKTNDTIWCKILYIKNESIFYSIKDVFTTQVDSIVMSKIDHYSYDVDRKIKDCIKPVKLSTREDSLRRKYDSILYAKEFKNSIYVELLGNGTLYSLNYERSIFHKKFLSVSARVGFSYFKWMGNNNNVFNVLFNMTSVFKIYNRIYFELGSGATYFINTYVDEYYKNNSILYIDFVCTAGLRIQNYNGFQWRLCFTPKFRSYDGSSLIGMPWGGISMGYSF
ncbi:MAG TPA: hypothetical protein PKN48_02450 [Bacteroidales bacterium]|nr:hypothetical protein [Bacteroidales bacterium]